MGGARGIDVFLSGRGLGELSLPDSLNGVAGLDRSVGDVTGRIAGYIPLWGGGHATHVLALRVSGGAASGPDAGPGYFDVGGAAGTDEPLTGLSLFGGEPLLFPVRGYDTSTRFGRFAWSTSAEYRFPLALVNRGLGAWPLHLDRIMGSLFVDAGNAWGPEVSATGFLNPIRSTLVGAGAEITTELLALFDVRMRLRTGVAVPFVEGDGARVYVRVGVPF
jgi:outer membrane protein assembly factor BamA